MMDGACGRIDVLVLLLAAVRAVAAFVRRLARPACGRCGVTDRRAWRFCPRCGSPRGDGHGIAAAPAKTRAMTTPLATNEPIPALPSELLRRGWRRGEEALSDSGYEVAPTSPAAVAWSVTGACDRAFEPHSAPWRAWRQELETILRERYGGVSARTWNRHPSRRRATVLAVAEEIERRIGISRDGGRAAPKGPDR
jgi:hypothetical protein